MPQLGMHINPSEGMILEWDDHANLPRHPLCDITNVHQPGHASLGTYVPFFSTTMTLYVRAHRTDQKSL